MEEMMKEGEFIEHATFSGNSYGTSKKSVLDILDSGEIKNTI
jgi:guanylate kinase